jgi:hypothetical protein
MLTFHAHSSRRLPVGITASRADESPADRCLWRFAWMLGLTLIGAGCGHRGPELGDVSGTVKLDGQFVEDLQIEFQPDEEGAPSYGVTDANGRYSLQYSPDRTGAIVGKHTVRITGERYDPETQTMKKIADIPSCYNSESELSAEVTGRGDTLDFNLESEGT